MKSYFSQHDPGYPHYSFTGTDPDNIGVNGGIYNRVGRGFPDVSAIGDHVNGIWNGHRSNEIGTSAAAPIWASVFTLINEKRHEAGKGPVGFVNPVLYEHPEVCCTADECCNYGFKRFSQHLSFRYAFDA